jgi:hypothetical protein
MYLGRISHILEIDIPSSVIIKNYFLKGTLFSLDNARHISSTSTTPVLIGCMRPAFVSYTVKKYCAASGRGGAIKAFLSCWTE